MIKIRIRTMMEKTLLKSFYKNQMSESYKTDDRILQSIIKRNTKCTNPEYTLKLMLYYKNLKTSALLLKNNERKNPDLKNTNV